MTDQALDDLARRLLLDTATLGWNDEINDQTEHTFSRNFERKMKPVIQRADHPVRYYATRLLTALLLMAFLGGGSLLTFSAEARASFTAWIREIQEQWFSYRYEAPELPTPTGTMYLPTFIPEGWHEIVAPELGNFVHVIFHSNEGEHFINYSYLIGRQKTVLNLQLEGMRVIKTQVNGMQAELYVGSSDRPNTLTWTDDALGIVFWLSGELAKNELLHIAESVEAVEPMTVEYSPTWYPPGGYWLDTPTEYEGLETKIMVDLNDETHRVYFGYSADEVPPLIQDITAEQVSEAVSLAGHDRTLWKVQRDGELSAVVWTDEDTGLTFYLAAWFSVDDLLRMAESVQVSANNFTDAMHAHMFDTPEEASRCYDFSDQNAEWTVFYEQVKEYARLDYQAEDYEAKAYEALRKEFQEEHISPQRANAISELEPIMESLRQSGEQQEIIVRLSILPYTASVTRGMRGNISVFLYNEYDEEIAYYNSDYGEWYDHSTALEQVFWRKSMDAYSAAWQAAADEADITKER
ncbi:MAG: DUF4367 domain-containing protein [Ruminiclostridium sp.]|nr:DUF4367 domain-containing protein [Ruminiclostridium sp.]